MHYQNQITIGDLKGIQLSTEHLTKQNAGGQEINDLSLAFLSVESLYEYFFNLELQEYALLLELLQDQAYAAGLAQQQVTDVCQPELPVALVDPPDSILYSGGNLNEIISWFDQHGFDYAAEALREADPFSNYPDVLVIPDVYGDDFEVSAGQTLFAQQVGKIFNVR